MKKKFKNKVTKAIHSYQHGDKSWLVKLLPELKTHWAKYAKEEGDFRTGEESYGYTDIKATMNYISDRWTCAFRMKWIIDLVERGFR